MKIKTYKTYEVLSNEAAAEIIRLIKKKPAAVVCVATGSSPSLMYEILAKEYRQNPALFSQVRIVKLDEWGGVPLSDPATCETEIRNKIIKPLRVSKDRYITFDNAEMKMEKSLAQYQAKIDAMGGIDICILGLGKNGHIGLNDPDSGLQLEAHVVRNLSVQTLHHEMTEKSAGKITFGLTLGLRSIFEAKKVLFLVSGKSKKDIFAKFMEKKISTQNPASLLWLHHNVLCLCDKDANN